MLVLVLSLPAAGQRYVGVPEGGPPGEADRARFVRGRLEDARGLGREGRWEAAERQLRRGLEFAETDAALWRELARVLASLGREAEAREARATADALDPPPGPLREVPLGLEASGVWFVLVPPPADAREASAARWPAGPAGQTLERRLAVRVPGAQVVHADFETVAAARAWLRSRAPRAVVSLRLDRIYCGDTIKDGRFGMAWLRAAIERPGVESAPARWARVVVPDPRLPEGCESEVTARALERVLALEALEQALAAPPPAGGFSTAAIRNLAPGLDARIDAGVAEGHQLLASGRVADAAEAFRRAVTIDPEDGVARAYLREAESTLALARELGGAGTDDPGVLDPRFSPAQRAAAEARLAEERRRRDELLAALAVMDEDVRLPDARVLDVLRPAEIREPEAFGPSLARRRAGGEVEARVAYAPDGSAIATYYFPGDDPLPVLREEDTNGDGQADRWIAYAGHTRSEIWEDARDLRRPDVRLVFGGDGAKVVRIEVDRDADGRPERIFHYADDRVTAEARDTSGDGRLDTFDRLESDGSVALREEDRDGDGRIDVRSYFRAGKLVRREYAAESQEIKNVP